MAESEVEIILREIRERVLAEQREAQLATSPPDTNGSGNLAYRFAETDDAVEHDLALINSYLVTTGRAWDRLPPVVSNRTGAFAQVELWFKRHMKRATRWYAWEQVNFNAAVHQALRDLLPLVERQQAQLRELRKQIDWGNARREELVREIVSRLEQLEAYWDRQRSADVIEAQTRLRDVLNEVRAFDLQLREVDARLREEQHVSFKQLSLESSERTVLEDRARRKSEDLLRRLEERVATLEKNGGRPTPSS